MPNNLLAPATRDFEWCWRLWENVKQYYDSDKYMAELKIDLDIYERRMLIDVGAGSPAIIPSTGRYSVDIPVAHTVTSKKLVYSPPKSNNPTKQQEEDAEAREKFGLAVLDYLEGQYDTSFLQEFVKNLFIFGVSIIEGPFYNPDYGEGELPLIVDVGDPQVWYFDPSKGRSRFAFKHYKRLTYDVMSRYPWWTPIGRDSKQVSMKEDLEWTEGYFYDAATKESWQFYAADGQPVAKAAGGPDVLPLGLPFLPMSRHFAGFGRRSQITSPQEQARSILFAVRDQIRMQAELLSQALAFGRAAAWVKYRTDQTDVNQFRNILKPATITYVPIGAQLAAEPIPQIPAGLFQLLGQVAEDIAKGTFSGIVGGEAPQGVRTASGLAILEGTARLRFGSPIENTERALSQLLERIGMIVDLVCKDKLGFSRLSFDMDKQEFQVLEAVASPAIFDGYYRYAVKLLPQDPEESNTRIAVGSAELDKHHIDMDTYFDRFLREPDKEKILRGIAKDKIMQSQEINTLVSQFIYAMLTGQNPMQQGQPATTGVNAAEAPTPAGIAQHIRAVAQQIRAGRSSTIQQPAPGGGVQSLAAELGRGTAPNGSPTSAAYPS